jgi:hypothetical protein
MLHKTLLIVSDKFHDFATRKDVITISELYNLLSSNNVSIPYSKKILLIPGQGFSEKQIEDILRLSSTTKNIASFDFSLWRNIPKRASTQLTHKQKKENILVSEPKRQSESIFNMNVLIDENCEMMRDHQTGLHIQGMLLVEAARQAYLATMEKFYIENSTEKNYFIFNKLNVGYNKFSFPLPSSIRLTNQKVDFSNAKRQHTITQIELIQCNEVSATVFMDVTIMPGTRVSTMESRFANQSLDNYINYALTENDANYNYQEVQNA